MFAKIYAPLVHCTIIHSTLDMETTQTSFGRWQDKEEVAPTYSGALLTLKKR